MREKCCLKLICSSSQHFQRACRSWRLTNIYNWYVFCSHYTLFVVTSIHSVHFRALTRHRDDIILDFDKLQDCVCMSLRLTVLKVLAIAICFIYYCFYLTILTGLFLLLKLNLTELFFSINIILWPFKIMFSLGYNHLKILKIIVRD